MQTIVLTPWIMRTQVESITGSASDGICFRACKILQPNPRGIYPILRLTRTHDIAIGVAELLASHNGRIIVEAIVANSTPLIVVIYLEPTFDSINVCGVGLQSIPSKDFHTDFWWR
jgi:hypothetical protein